MVIEQGMGTRLRDQVFHEDSGGMMFDRMTHERPYSEETARSIDEEVETLIKEAAKRAELVIAHNMKHLEALAKRLLEDETVDETVVNEVFAHAVLPKEARLY
jgi:cell division protease FtsH